MQQTHFDVAIIGGGPTGAALALALRGSGLQVAVLEARPAGVASSDVRALALSYGSRLLLDRLGVWDTLHPVSAIRTIHISQQRSFGRAKLRAAEMRVPELGYVLPYATLQNGLDAALHASGRDGFSPSDLSPPPCRGRDREGVETSALEASTPIPTFPLQGGRSGLAGISIFNQAQVSALCGEDGQAVLTWQQAGGEAQTLTAKLAVVADGGKLLAQQFPPTFHDYGQSAVIAHLTVAAPQPDTAFERFTPQGPVALLPYQDGYELVWTAPHDAAQAMLHWDEAHFLRSLHAHFGDRVGAFRSVGPRSCFPLGLKRAPTQTPLPHTVLLGNAAQTLHPVAGQGFNMGVRDAWELAQVILDSEPAQLGTPAMLARYVEQRKLDRSGGIRFTDGLVRLFSNDLPLLKPARAAALSVLDSVPLAKRFVAKRMMFGANG